MTKKNRDIDEFMIAINNLLSSKYILVDRRITDLLMSIVDTVPVYNLIAESMINFDFKEEWKNATNGMYLKYPETDAKRISFIFCLLNNIDEKNLDLTNLLEKYFSYDAEISPYELFCNQIVIEFRRLILKNLHIENDNNLENSVDENGNVELNKFEILSKMLNDLANDVAHAKKIKKSFMQKQDLVAVISTFEQVARDAKTEYFYSFMVTLKANLLKDKNYNKRVIEICELANELILRG